MPSIRINNNYSNKCKVMYGIPRGPVLGLLLFNIDLIGLFLECEDDDINSHADDTIPYSWAEDVSSVMTKLQIFRALTFQSSSEVTKRLHNINLLFFR